MNTAVTKISVSAIGLMLLVVNTAAAQFDYNAILPPSPTAASLGQYGSIPVSNYTGTPNISIPIETIKGRELQLPISLSYMAKGIKVEENASWVGTGWSLNCGGVITQTVRGHEDGSRPRAMFPVPTDFAQAKEYIMNIQHGLVDTEPDQYYFNYPGGSGSFVLDGNGDVVFEDANDVKVVADTQNHQFTITSEDGTQYIFSIAENTQYIGSSSTAGTSAVYLSKMVSASGREVIDFIYGTAVTRFYSLSRPVRRIRPFNVKEDVYAPTFGINIVTCRPLTEIITNFGTRVTFTPEDLPRQDLSIIGDPSVASRALKSIQFFDQFNNPGKKYVFNYETVETNFPYAQYTAYDPPLDQNTTYANYRLYLKSVGEAAEDGSIVVPPYEFTYAGRTTDNKDMLPNKLSPAQDHWGYFNGQTQNLSLWPGYVGPYGYYDENFVSVQNYCSLTFGLFQSPQVSFPGANREPRFPDNSYGTLSKVKYPTSGTTTYDFESQMYLFNAQSNSIVTRPVAKVAQAFVAGNATTELDHIVTADASNDVGHFSFEFSVECRDKDTKAPKQCATPNSEINLEKYQENSVSLFDSQGIEVIAAKWILGDGGFRIYKGGQVDPNYQTLQPTSDGFITMDIVGLTFYNGQYTLKAHRDADGDKDVFGWFYFVHQETVPELTDKYAKSAGGLRIKKIESFDDFGRSVGAKRYEYGPGVLVDPPLYNMYGYQSGLPIYLCPRNGEGATANMFIHVNSGPVAGSGITKGSPVGYQSVKEIQDGNGSIEYEYTTALEYPDFNFETDPIKITYFFWDYWNVNTGFDNFTVTKSFWPFPPVDAVDRKRGFLKKISVRNEAGQLIKTIESVPHITDENVVMGIRFQTLRPDQDWFWSTYKLSSGFVNVALQTETSLTHAPDTEMTKSTSMYYEGNGHHQITKKVTTNSDNSVLVAEMKYPDDYTTITDPSHPIVRMKKQDLHVINSPIETRTSLDGLRIDGTLGVFTSINKAAGGYFIAPKKIYKFKISSTSVPLTWESNPLLPDTTSKFERQALMYFDNLGNVRKVISKDGVRKVYLWETGNPFPVAEGINAEPAEIFCTSFEANSSATYSATGAKGGTRYWNSGSFNFTTDASFTPENPASLKMSYWYWQGTSWTFSGEIPFNNAISSPGSRLDEIRVYPTDARVSTFTSLPLSGITSTADVNSIFKFFEYDKLGRLRIIRDQDGNIVRRYTYHFGEE